MAVALNRIPLSRCADVVARGAALFLGCFSAMNAVAVFAGAELGQDLWWIDLGSLPGVLSSAVQVLGAAVLIAYALVPIGSLWRRVATAGVAAALGAVAIGNAFGFYGAWRAGSIAPGVAVPLSLVVGVALLAIAARAARGDRSPVDGAGRVKTATVVVVAAGLALAFPLAQVLFFGSTDYRRPADVAVVLGARVYADGSLSPVLDERVRTGVDLYHEGLVGGLVMSGGVGESGIDEACAMRDRAIALGVSSEDITLDSAGVDTDATVENTVALFRDKGFSRVLVVSHFYHLPRIKLAYRAAGFDVCTVPARHLYPIGKTPLFVAREAAGFWVYWLRGWARALAS